LRERSKGRRESTRNIREGLNRTREFGKEGGGKEEERTTGRTGGEIPHIRRWGKTKPLRGKTGKEE